MDLGELPNKPLHLSNGGTVLNEPLIPLLPRIMAEKRRSGVPVGGVLSESRSSRDRDFLSQAGVGGLLRGALLKMVEARAEDPVGFLADHFCNLLSEESETNPGTAEGDGEMSQAGVLEQQTLNRALWHLRLAHHSQRSAFSNNVRVAYDLLSQAGPRKRRGGVTPSRGGVRGFLYSQTLQCLCSEGGVPASTSAPLLLRLRCLDHEAVTFDLFRHGVLTCAIFSDYIRRSQRLYAEVCGPSEGPAARLLCQAVLGTLNEALETSQGCEASRYPNANAKVNPYLEASAKANRYLEASAKISPCKLAQAMAQAHTAGGTAGPNMDAKEFEDAAAQLFISRVRVVS